MANLNAQIIPMSIVMMAGPQIITPLLMMTAKKPVKVLAAYAFAVFLATVLGTVMVYYVLLLLRIDSVVKANPLFSKVLETLLIIFLFYLTIKTVVNRKNVTMPNWMKSLQNADPKFAFKLGLKLIFFMPTDIVAMLTVALVIHNNQVSILLAWPFVLATAAIASIPLLLFAIFHKKIIGKMDRIRLWLDNNNWLIQTAIYLVFIILIWA